ncbi:unnamed protein product [Blepharisma stoltei]|uniref:Uncharacterized protein n=1 Tax=Blepharisma stoltei TaxID=1481888 RepID=A0AAU9KA42_9CILI|nr:unnamed protein product [Blepharisma stoltei]
MKKENRTYLIASSRLKASKSPIILNKDPYNLSFSSDLKSSTLTPKSPIVRTQSPSISHKRYRETSFVFFPQSTKAQSPDRKSFSFEKPESIEQKYEALKENYKILWEENQILKKEIGLISSNESTKSTLKLEGNKNEFDQLKASFANEIENLYEQLSSSHESIQILLAQLRQTIEEFEDLRKSMNYLRFNLDVNESTKDVKINLLEETLKKKIEESGTFLIEKRKLEGIIEDLNIKLKENSMKMMEKEERIELLEKGVNFETVSNTDLIQKLSKTKKQLKASEEKTKRLEEFIKSSMISKQS